MRRHRILVELVVAELGMQSAQLVGAMLRFLQSRVDVVLAAVSKCPRKGVDDGDKGTLKDCTADKRRLDG